ncbi:phosphotransferase [Nocardioides daejeonensis]|uniref:phosphotransferase n=1 Tax=Nocardioides daejeonensis TaxID=1046556 RepID=UPI000D747566|nr:phosphotransferase [Nocardioides daejeonensis]
MWRPQPGWHALPGGRGPCTLGVWRAVLGEQPVVVKRLAAPQPGDPGELSDPHHFAWWRRDADVQAAGLVEGTTGLRAPGRSAVDEDDDGITIIQPWVEDAANNGLVVARCLGRFAGERLHYQQAARNQLRDRMRRVAHNGGWRTLARTTVADVADRLWARQLTLLDELDDLPQVVQHGDPTPANLLGREGDDVLAIDWGSLGHGPVGSDLGYYALSAREEFTPLVDAYLLGLPDGIATRAEVEHGARVTAVLTAVNRVEWALFRAAAGEGALAAKYRHPAVAPYIRSLQRLFPEVERLL